MSAAPTPAEAAAAVLAARKTGRRICTAVVTRSASGLTGNRCWITDGALTGSLGDPALDAAVATAFSTVFRAQESFGAVRREFDYEDPAGADCVATVYIELHAPPAKLVVVGAGHVAVPLARLGAMLGFRVEVLDDRPEFADPARFPEAAAVRVIDFRDPFAATRLTPPDHVVLVTRGHRFDYECLARLLRMERPPGYVGMIGSRRRVRATHEQLAREEFTLEEMKRVRAPVGLDLGGQTPVEIAVSVAAEIVMHRSGGTGAPLFRKERVAERFFTRR